jgi:hypothetical protein
MRLVALALVASAGIASADTVIVPNVAESQAGTGGYSTILNSQARSYQMVTGSAELTGIPVGSRITGITWRRPSWQAMSAWPAGPATFTNFDVTLSTSNFPPGQLHTTYTENIGPDAVQVRAGQMVFETGWFPGGATTPNVNPFGRVVEFTTPYVYQGGDLLLTIRHSGNGFSSGSLDTVTSPNCEAKGVSSFTQEFDWYVQGPIVMQLTFEAGGGCPADFNGDNQVDFFDYLDFAAAFDAEDPSADFNGDNQIDFFDYLDFAAAFDLGCE